MTPFRLSIILVILIGVAAWQTALIPSQSFQISPVGPVFVPTAVVVLIAIMTVAYGIRALRGQEVDLIGTTEDPPLPGGHLRVLALLGGGLMFMMFIGWLGFFIPATGLAVLVAYSFSASIKSVKTWLISSAICLCFWALFTWALKVNLGPLFRIPGVGH